MQRHPPKQHQPRLQYFEQNKNWSEGITRLKDHSHWVREKTAEVIGTFPKKFNLHIAVHNKSGRKKNELSKKEKGWIENFLERSDINYTFPEEGILSMLEWTVVKESISKNDTYFGISVTY